MTDRHAAQGVSTQISACMLCAQRTVTMGSSSFGMWKNAIIKAMATRINCQTVHTISTLEAAGLCTTFAGHELSLTWFCSRPKALSR